MAQLVAIPQAEWQNWFTRMSGALRGKRAEIEVASLELGDQIVAEWIPLIGITYDEKSDVLDVALEGVDHLIQHPRDVVVDLRATGVESIAVVDGDGTKQVVRLKSPLTLPPASTA